MESYVAECHGERWRDVTRDMDDRRRSGELAHKIWSCGDFLGAKLEVQSF